MKVVKAVKVIKIMKIIIIIRVVNFIKVLEVTKVLVLNYLLQFNSYTYVFPTKLLFIYNLKVYSQLCNLFLNEKDSNSLISGE